MGSKAEPAAWAGVLTSGVVRAISELCRVVEGCRGRGRRRSVDTGVSAQAFRGFESRSLFEGPVPVATVDRAFRILGDAFRANIKSADDFDRMRESEIQRLFECRD